MLTPKPLHTSSNAQIRKQQNTKKKKLTEKYSVQQYRHRFIDMNGQMNGFWGITNEESEININRCVIVRSTQHT